MVFETVATVRSVMKCQLMAIDHLPPGAIMGPLFLGAVGGFGGTLIGNVVTKFVESPEEPSEFSKPTWASKAGLYVSLIYFFLGKSGGVFFGGPLVDDKALRIGIISVMVSHQIAETVTGINYVPHPIRAIEWLFFTTTGIPSTPAPSQTHPSQPSSEKKKN